MMPGARPLPIDPSAPFRSAIEAAGLTAPETIEADGRLHRFPSNGKAADDAGWYVLHGDGIPAGSFGDWRTGLSETWRADLGRALTPAEEARHQERVTTMRRQREAEEARRRSEAADKAAAVWRAASKVPADNPYLTRKQVAPVATLREIGADQAAQILGYVPRAKGEPLTGVLLVVPVKVGGRLSTLELIDGEGRKTALFGGAKAGGYWGAQPLPEGDGAGLTLLIGEGVATVLSAKEATEYPAVAALSSGNLVSVARTLRTRYPAAALVVLADLIKATGEPDPHAAEAAQAVGGRLAVPDFGPDRPDGATDFNDLAQTRGLEAVHAAVAAQSRDRQTAAPAGPTSPEVQIVCAAGIRPEPIEWLWPGWLAAGKVHILAGSPGTGKTSIALAMGASITAGGRWPDGTRAPLGDVLIWSGEDDPKDTLIPRLLACGADLQRAHIVSGVVDRDGHRAFDPANDTILLLEAARAIERPIRLLIVDPVVSAVSGDSHKNAEVRRALQPLVDLGQALRCAVIGITHFSKSTAGRDPVDRVNGSLAFGALARIVLAAAKLPEDDGRVGVRLLARAKSNIGPDDGGYEYHLDIVEAAPGVEATRVTWGAAVEGSARELLAMAEPSQGDLNDDSALSDAKRFLLDMLRDGPVESKVIYAEARGAGHAERTLHRAKKELGIEAEKEGKGGWKWAKPAKGCQPSTTQTVGNLGNLGSQDSPKAEGCQDCQDFETGKPGNVWQPSSLAPDEDVI